MLNAYFDYDLDNCPKLKSLFGATNIVKIRDKEKWLYRLYSGHGTAFN